MDKKQINLISKVIPAAAFAAMVTVNALANILPLNGKTTGEVSDSYPNLFTPAALTFSIWGVIYLLLACYTLYHLGLFRKKPPSDNGELLRKIGWLFTASSLANAGWIFAWHYDLIFLSVLLMAVILLCLIFINRLTHKTELSTREKFFVQLPFSVYFGWITVATIANITVWLVSLGWDGCCVPESTWAAIILVAGMIIGHATMLRHKDIAYGLVLIWAYTGILIKHLSPDGFAGQYSEIIATVIACLVLFVLGIAYLLFSRFRAQKGSAG